MSTAEVKEVLRRIRLDAKVPSVSFTGGEPTLRDDLCELVAFARELDFRINLITNGTRMSRRLARRLARAGLHSAQVSLEGTTAAAHEVITGVRGSFRRSVEAVAHLERAGIGVHTNTTLNLRNLGEAPLLPRFVRRKLGRERLSMNLVIPSGTAAAAEGLLLRYSEVGPVVEEVMAASEAAGVEFMWYSPTPLCIFNPIIHGLGNKGCSACDGLLSVDARGDVLPCSSFPEPVGNLLEQDFARIWHSSRAADLRQKSLAYGSCRDCDSFAACHGACPLYWRHFGFGELEGRFVSSIDSLRRLAV
jgi:radical SAM protein with 4Fe4S-binding SPASM domain